MCSVKLLDEAHLRLQLGGRLATLDIPAALQPTYDVNATLDAPEACLELAWVHGYRGKDSRNNLVFLETTGELVYTMAGVVVLRKMGDPGSPGAQRHYLEHTDDVMCIALHPDKVTMASGQVASHKKKEGKPHVRIWKSTTLETLHVIGQGVFARALCCVAFSRDESGKMLCCVDESNDHVLSVWDWESEIQLAESKSSKEPVLDIEFDFSDPNQLVSCGRGQITFWTLDENNKLSNKRGIFQNNVKPKYIMCVAFSPKGFMVSGDSNGAIFIWNKNTIERALTGAHDDAVFSVNFLHDGRLVSGGRGRQVVLWDAYCTAPQAKIQVDDFYGPVRSVVAVPGSEDDAGLQMFVGTTKNCLLKGNMEAGFEPMEDGHRDEVWALCSLPLSAPAPGFLTSAYDGRLFLWDAASRQPTWAVDLKYPGTCVGVSSDCELVVVGCQTGNAQLINGKDGTIYTNSKVSKEQIQCCAFAPEGGLVALGSRDNNVYLFDASAYTLETIGVCRGHSSFILHLDWTTNGGLLRTNSGDYEILYWTMPNCEREMADDVIEQHEWQTNSCTFTFNSVGIWGDANDGTDVNASAANTNKSLLASGDDFGAVNLYRFPCNQFKADKKVGVGHSSHVTNVVFLGDDKTLVSAGGRDMSIIQWNIIV